MLICSVASCLRFCVAAISKDLDRFDLTIQTGATWAPLKVLSVSVKAGVITILLLQAAVLLLGLVVAK